MKKIINKQEVITQEYLKSLFLNYPQLIGYGSIYLYVSLYFYQNQDFNQLLAKQNINIFEGEMFLDKLSAAKLVSITKKDNLESIIVHPPILGNFTLEEFQQKVYQHQIDLKQENVSKTYGDVWKENPFNSNYEMELMAFYKQTFNVIIKPNILLKISEFMTKNPTLKNPLINIALEKTKQQCQEFNAKYFFKICTTFLKLNIDSIDKAKLYLGQNNFFKEVNQEQNLNLLDEEIKKL